MNRNAHGTWLQNDEPGAEAGQESVTIRLPDLGPHETPTWNDSTVYIQRIHDALVSKGWASTGPM